MEMEAESELCEVDVSSDGRDGGVWLGGTGCGGEVRSIWTGCEGDVRSTLTLAELVVGGAELASGRYPKLYPRMSASRLEVEGSCSPGAAGCCSANGKLPYERGEAKAGTGGGDEAAEVPRSPVSPNRNVPWFAVGSTGGGKMAADWLGCSWCCCSPAGETSMSTYCAWAVTLGGMTVEMAEGSTSNNPGA